MPIVKSKNVQELRLGSGSYEKNCRSNSFHAQRVEIFKVLYREAEILIFDEPTAVLTPQEIEFLLGIIEGLRNSGKTIILMTHKLEEIKKVADRCAVLNKG